MPIAIRYREAPRPELTVLAGLRVRRESRPDVMAALQGREVDELARRFGAGHFAYVAEHGGELAGWGWAATRTARIGELDSDFLIPEGDRYLWNFVTLPSHRGLGVYPRLLDAIVTDESDAARRYWVAYAPENHASGAGIRKAGFADVAELSFDADGQPAVRDIVRGGSRLAAEVLGLPTVRDTLARCWRCVKKAEGGRSSCHAGPCSCDYQIPASGCDAGARL